MSADIIDLQPRIEARRRVRNIAKALTTEQWLLRWTPTIAEQLVRPADKGLLGIGRSDIHV